MVPQFWVKIANFKIFFCLSIAKRDFLTKKATPNIDVCPESLGAMVSQKPLSRPYSTTYIYVQQGIFRFNILY